MLTGDDNFKGRFDHKKRAARTLLQRGTEAKGVVKGSGDVNSQ